LFKIKISYVTYNLILIEGAKRNSLLFQGKEVILPPFELTPGFYGLIQGLLFRRIILPLCLNI